MGRKPMSTFYYYLTVTHGQHSTLKAEAEARGVSMAQLVREGLNRASLKLPDVGGVKCVSVGLRVTQREVDRFNARAEKKGMSTASWMRSRLFQ